jgi:demethylmenaquinone methyltransferase / 2-methoxy-6-polyprenyl-1,4-benzoquinol methylase
MPVAPHAQRSTPQSSQSAGGSSRLPGGEYQKTRDVSAMFDRIAHRYDFLNRFLSAGIDRTWRRKAVDRLAALHPKSILDVAAGTGDMIVECLRLHPERVAGIDPSQAMLDVARAKIASQSSPPPVELTTGSAERLPFPAGSFDAVTCAFGVRNFANLEEGLSEFFRVLRPGGSAVILEFSQPQGIPGEKLYRFYFTHLLPFVGGLVSGDRSAYQYLHDTVDVFPSGGDFLSLLRDASFADLHSEMLSYGIATIYTGTKPDVVWS